jgi:hypothetical protein
MSERKISRIKPVPASGTFTTELWDHYIWSVKEVARTEGVADSLIKGVAFFPLYLAISTIAIGMDAARAVR